MEEEILKYTLIGSCRLMKESKLHISKEIKSIDVACGRYLGFDYHTLTFDKDDSVKLFTKEEILKNKAICKKCLKKLTRN